ncbi:MAG: hypothetical protein M3548_00665 [Actinomycetota bacterium]|nr:hypothetical protein [Actinomycetota bacterium]
MAEREDASTNTRHRRGTGQLRGRIAGIVAGLIRWIGLLFALVLVAHIILVMGDANPDNWITGVVRDLADPFALAFKNLFTPEDAKLGVLINYGLAAVFWLVVSSVAAKFIRRLG